MAMAEIGPGVEGGSCRLALTDDDKVGRDLFLSWCRAAGCTVDMPRLGLNAPMNAQIRIVLPDGRVAKAFKVLYVSQPDIVVHGESVPFEERHQGLAIE